MLKQSDDVDARLGALEKRLDSLTRKVLTSQVIFSTVTAYILGSVSADLQRQCVGELRNCISVKTEGFSDPLQAELMVIETEEVAQQMLDQIEHMADVYRQSKALDKR